MSDRDLQTLLRGMEPVLHERPYGYAHASAVPPGLAPFATVSEPEGITLVADHADLLRAGFSSDLWARISLTVNSDLTAVGLTAAFATALTREGISANVVAGFFHDHIFVPWARREDAMAALLGLSRD